MWIVGEIFMHKLSVKLSMPQCENFTKTAAVGLLTKGDQILRTNSRDSHFIKQFYFLIGYSGFSVRGGSRQVSPPT